MSQREILEGKVFGDFQVNEYLGNKKYRATCLRCGESKILYSHNMKNLVGVNCSLLKTNIDLTGKLIGEWKVLEYIGKKKYLCKCSCGNTREVLKANLLNGTSTSCGHDRQSHGDLTNKVFNDWTVLEKVGYKWKCKCTCGKVALLGTSDLVKGKSKSCGHGYNTFYDISGKQFGEWLVIEYQGNQHYKCQCSCGTIASIRKADLLSLRSESCGCKKRLKSRQTLLQKYENCTLKPDSKYTEYKKDIYEFITSIYTGNVVTDSEYDIYIPDKKIAIEFNGNYWHSDIFKDKYYHQKKTIDCAKQGIHLIHIFEYEWNDDTQQSKIKNYIKRLLSNDTKKVYARNTIIKQIEYSEVKEFEDKYHLQSASLSSINIGCFGKENNELLGVMTFGKPRFTSDFEYELIRLCWKADVNVIGGTEKLFNYFIKEYSPRNILTYCDISKFTGNVYTRLAFKPMFQDTITEPNYVWVNCNSNVVLNRYKTQKQKLIDMGLGDDTSTESDIMRELDFLKIYNSGNLKLVWSNI